MIQFKKLIEEDFQKPTAIVPFDWYSRQPPYRESGNIFHIKPPIGVDFLLFERVNFPSLSRTDTEPDQEHNKYYQDHEHDNTDRY